MRRNVQRIIWVQKLGVIEIIVLLVRAFYSKISVHYDEYQVTSAGNWLLNFLKYLNICKNYYPAELTLAKKGSHYSIRRKNISTTILTDYVNIMFPVNLSGSQK